MKRTSDATAALVWAVIFLAVIGSISGCGAPSSDPGGAEEATRLGPGDPRPAIVDVVREPDAYARAARLANLLAALGPEAVPEVRSALRDPSIDLGAVELELLERFWATHDPEAASEWAYGYTGLGYRVPAITTTFELWARVDPESTLRWIRAISSGGVVRGPYVDTAEAALIRGWFYSGRPGLVDFIRDMGPSDERQRSLGIYARQTIRRDGTAAVIRWAEALPDQDKRFKLDAFRQVASELAQAEPAAGVAWCEAHCEGPFGAEVRELVANRWAAKDGQSALRWLSSLPPGSERDAIVRLTFRSWWRSDPEAAHAWLAAMGTDGIAPWFEPALNIVALALAWEDPHEAMRWAALIEDDAGRETVIINVARTWRNQDAAAADAWLEQSPLSEENREAVRNPKRVGRKPQGPGAANAPAEPPKAPQP